MPSSPEILQVLVDIIRREMCLKADQVVIYNQRWIIPNDSRVYVSLHLLGSKPYGVNRGYSSQSFLNPSDQTVTTVLNEEQSINTADMISVHVTGYGDTARVRRNEVMFALHSTYAEQKMEQYGFSIGQVPTSFADVSEAMGTAYLYRYAITFNVLYAQGVTKPVDYFDSIEVGEPVIQP
jgi:hypothetical protein